MGSNPGKTTFIVAPLVPKIDGVESQVFFKNNSGLGGMIHQATKQGQGGRSQPVIRKQGGTSFEARTPRGKSVDTRWTSYRQTQGKLVVKTSST